MGRMDKSLSIPLDLKLYPDGYLIFWWDLKQPKLPFFDAINRSFPEILKL
jgi:hypothetical protein